MNPKSIARHLASIMTDWHNASTKEPGQPGVFEVDPVTLDDSGEERRRFSYFDGKKFGPLSTSVEGAYRERFNHSTLSSTITKWRGYAEEV